MILNIKKEGAPYDFSWDSPQEVILDIPNLPIAVTAPEWMEQKATIDGVFAVAYGAYTHLSPTPFITGAPQVVKLLTEDVETLTGGKVALGDDPIQVADDIEAHIVSKRKKLGLQ